jgi:C-terminal processing protease CtpA/Prc
VQIDVARVVFPDGGELQKNGVTLDVPCTPTSKEMREEQDVGLWKAVAMAREKLGLSSEACAAESKSSDTAY